MDAGLETIGARCSCCNKQDFLPFKCSHCALSFCLDHARQDAHTCAALSTVPQQSNQSDTKTTTGPSLKALQAEHLARRRISPQPGKQSAANVQNKQEATDRIQGALKALKTRFTLPKTATATRTAEEARMLGALKREAKGDPKLPVAQRRYVYVQGSGKSKHARYVSVDWTCGRTLDELAKVVDMQNDNARTTDPARKLHLLLVEEDLVLEPSQSIGARLKRDGLTLQVYRGIRPQQP
ncbi:hypothetical protein BCR37DRAFT_379502 [Protomyces lactucae-debilis]|uniref:AN1-type domain-containing protein n=1 Tax=Protomyces lactucae-debilis TaxID=2754530 RepID=A0A1Y2FEZ4_PROLT|nr:uncharacterized protein BCR37DRAFT_379502 [Protomyces lactucae-debilis]ORY82503.1 hypothetical protein BCR37DRAFT_379502 [Protomyces lactucae-debilis]